MDALGRASLYNRKLEHFHLAENLQKVEERLERVLARTARAREAITLLAVTKVFPVSAILEAYALGQREFGENYVQEFSAKYGAVQQLEGARFHLIGHLQSNKSRQAGEIFDCIQTVDSAKLARRLDETRTGREGSSNQEGRGDIPTPPGPPSVAPPARGAKPLDILLEVKLSPEESKEGASPGELPALIDAVRMCPRLRLRGLMTMPPWSENPEHSRPYFRQLAQLGEQHGLRELSMGMSHDFEAAIEEGATIIRVGTALFGRRQKPGT